MYKWAVVCVCAYDNEVSSVDLFDSYENSPAKTKQDAENLFNDLVDAKLKKGC